MRINAVVVLSDGVNEDLESSDDEQQLDALITSLRDNASSELAKPIRIFPIAYGEAADLDVLRRIAEASNSTVYDASDPATIDRVFAAVVSNF
jgi:Ca-activated chloride channel family protein